MQFSALIYKMHWGLDTKRTAVAMDKSHSIVAQTTLKQKNAIFKKGNLTCNITQHKLRLHSFLRVFQFELSMEKCNKIKQIHLSKTLFELPFLSQQFFRFLTEVSAASSSVNLSLFIFEASTLACKFCSFKTVFCSDIFMWLIFFATFNQLAFF